jgi:hypothetical protein
VKRSWTAIFGACVAAAVGSALLIATSGGSASAEDAYTDAHAQAALVKAAVASGDSNVTHGQWVRVTRGIANALTSGASIGVENSEDVVLVEARGNFIATYAHPPYGAPLPTGTEMTLILDPISGQVLDYGLSHAAVDLSSVGTVHRF